MAKTVVYTDVNFKSYKLELTSDNENGLINIGCFIDDPESSIDVYLSIEDAEQLISDLVSMTERIKAIKSQEK